MNSTGPGSRAQFATYIENFSFLSRASGHVETSNLVAEAISSSVRGGVTEPAPDSMRRWVRFLVAALYLSASLAYGAEFVIVNQDDPDVGLNDPTPVDPVGINQKTTLGAQRLFALESIGAIWAAELASDVPIRVGVQFMPLLCKATSATLASARPASIFRDFSEATVPGTWHHAALADALQGINVDLNPGPDRVDIDVDINLAIDDGCFNGGTWYYGVDGNPPSGTIDIVPVMLHELAHGLGFSTFVSLQDRFDENDELIAEAGEKVDGFDDVFMRQIGDVESGTLFWPEMTNAERADSAVNDPNVVWLGPNVEQQAGRVVTASGAFSFEFLRLHAPDPVEEGGSISHWTTDAFPNLLMEPVLRSSLRFGELDLTVDMLADIGWPLSVLFADGFESPPPTE